MKKIGIIIIILSIVFVGIVKFDVYFSGGELSLNYIEKNRYYVRDKAGNLTEISKVHWYCSFIISITAFILLCLDSLLYLYVMRKYVLPYIWFKKYEDIFNGT